MRADTCTPSMICIQYTSWCSADAYAHRRAWRQTRAHTSSSLSSATCLRLMKTSMCQRCPGVAKTKHTMYNQADKRCILSPPTQTPIPSCQSAEGTHTRGSTREERSPSSMTHHTLLIFKSDKSFEFLASQDGEPDDGLRAFLLVSLAAAAMKCHSG